MIETAPATEAAWHMLRTILDPEFAISIVDLGLIYSVTYLDGNVDVIMTLTTPTCPSGSWIHQGVDAALRQIPDVKDVRVTLTFDPPWSPAMLTAEARRHLGLAEES